MIKLRVVRSGVIIFTDPANVTYAVRPDKTKPAIVFIEGITEAFEVVTEEDDGS